MKNKWKRLSLFLLGIDLLVVVSIISLIMIPSTTNERISRKEPTGDNVSFHVKSNKNDLNQIINYYLKKETADSPIDYHVHLGNEVELYGVLPILSETLNMKLTFEPEALSNGDLVLKQKALSIGSLHLPVSYVLQYISENYKLPEGVIIQPNDKLIYINMQQLKLKSDLIIKVNKFDLKKDDIAFTILVPVK